MENLCRRKSVQGKSAHQRLRRRHEQRGRNSFAGNISDRKEKTVLINEYKVIQIAADLFCRFHHGIDINVGPPRKRGKPARQHGRLNLRGGFKVGFDPLFLTRRVVQIPDIIFKIVRHAVEGIGKFFDFITGFQFQLPVQISGADLFCTCNQLANRIAEVFRKHITDKKNNRKHEQRKSHENLEVHAERLIHEMFGFQLVVMNLRFRFKSRFQSLGLRLNQRNAPGTGLDRSVADNLFDAVDRDRRGSRLHFQHFPAESFQFSVLHERRHFRRLVPVARNQFMNPAAGNDFPCGINQERMSSAPCLRRNEIPGNGFYADIRTDHSQQFFIFSIQRFAACDSELIHA